MDTVTHALTGAVIGYSGFRQRSDGGQLALWTCIAAAEFPDIDVLMLTSGSDSYLHWHRSFTHSALLCPLWAALVAGISWSLARNVSFKFLWKAALAGIVSHLFLDWITSYGTELLWPVTDRRFAASWLFILDPYVWAMLGVTLWAVLRTGRAGTARTGLAIIGGYILMCAACRFVSLQTSGGDEAFAQPLNPFRWTIVRTESDAVHWIDGNRNDTFRQFHDDKLLPQAEATETVKLYRWFAAIPLVEKVQENGQTVLRYRDLRFRSPMPWGPVREGMFIIAKVYFDKDGRLLHAVLASEDR